MVLGSTTVNASPVSTDDFQYQVYNDTKKELYISKSAFYYVSNKRMGTTDYWMKNGVRDFFPSNNYYWAFLYSRSPYTYILYYVDGSGWAIDQSTYISTVNGYSVRMNQYSIEDNLYTDNTISGITSAGSIPSDLPAIENLEDILNSTTSTTSTAQELQSDLASSYSSYQSGNISGDALQSDIDTTVSTLNNLSETPGNTLADLIAVNNGLTYAQTVQDKLNADELNEHLEISTAVKNVITGYINQSNTAYNDYTNGNKTQSETITTLQNQVIYLNQIITNGTAKNSADIEAVNTAINTVQGIINNVSNYSDLDKELSSEYESGEQAEKEFLENEIAETTSQIQDMSAENQFSTQQKTESLNILGSIWDLEIFKRLIPICAVFMVVCVAIGVKYRL